MWKRRITTHTHRHTNKQTKPDSLISPDPLGVHTLTNWTLTEATTTPPELLHILKLLSPIMHHFSLGGAPPRFTSRHLADSRVAGRVERTHVRLYMSAFLVHFLLLAVFLQSARLECLCCLYQSVSHFSQSLRKVPQPGCHLICGRGHGRAEWQFCFGNWKQMITLWEQEGWKKVAAFANSSSEMS